MRRAVLVVWLLVWAAAFPVCAQEAEVEWEVPPASPAGQAAATAPAPVPEVTASPTDKVCGAEPPAWQIVWGVAGIDVFPAGPRVAPNGHEYHPYHSLDLDFNIWVWRSQGLYLFSDARFWNEKPEYGVTNSRDTFLGFSKREFDMVFGPAWNYAGSWEARCFGYTFNNLNRGNDPVKPAGLLDGFGMENRYYLSQEYARLGRAGFDITRADFLSVGYYITKEMVDNDGRLFKPGLMLRAYLTCDLWDWPAYAFGDVTYIGEQSLQPKLLLYDVGVAVRPLAPWESLKAWKNWEIRLGVENSADLQEGSVLNLWYAALRVIF
jgi:hypothetical protein